MQKLKNIKLFFYTGYTVLMEATHGRRFLKKLLNLNMLLNEILKNHI